MKKKERICFQCASCSKPVFKLPCQVRNPVRVYCSKACQGKAKQNGSTLFCAMCDSPFYRRFGEQGNSKNQFCSSECYGEWRLERIKETTYKKQGKVHVHRIIAESVLKRPLTKKEVVHHIDLDKHNNSLDNLAVLPSQTFHAKVHQGKVSIDEIRRLSLAEITKG